MRPVDNGLPLIHGHVHNSWKVNGRQINVGVDVWDFTPVSEADLSLLVMAMD
jgi:calcineurin-like phosphoesterase family protein